MALDTDKTDAVLALLFLTRHDHWRAWKRFDWDALRGRTLSLRPRSVPSEEEACLALRRCDLLTDISRASSLRTPAAVRYPRANATLNHL